MRTASSPWNACLLVFARPRTCCPSAIRAEGNCIGENHAVPVVLHSRLLAATAILVQKTSTLGCEVFRCWCYAEEARIMACPGLGIVHIHKPNWLVCDGSLSAAAIFESGCMLAHLRHRSRCADAALFVLEDTQMHARPHKKHETIM